MIMCTGKGYRNCELLTCRELNRGVELNGMVADIRYVACLGINLCAACRRACNICEDSYRIRHVSIISIKAYSVKLFRSLCSEHVTAGAVAEFIITFYHAIILIQVADCIRLFSSV